MTGADLRPVTDAELVRRAISAHGDPGQLAPVFEAIAERYCDTVLRWCAGKGLDHQAAQDVGQTVFEEAFTSLAGGRGPKQADMLGRWLAGFVRNRALSYFRQHSLTGHALLPADASLEDLPDDQENRSGYAVRLAHASKLVSVVVASLEERHREIYRLYFVEHLTGRQIAERLAINEKTASNRVTRVQQVVAEGFGALILAQEGRPYCTVLAGLLDAAQVQVITEKNFTAALRTRIVRHFDSCDKCDRCQVCADKRKQLVGPYTPALIPMLFGAEFRDRIGAVIRQVCGRQEPPDQRPRRRGRRPLRRAPVAAGAAVLVVILVVAAVLVIRPGGSHPAVPGKAAAAAAGAPAGHWRELRTLADPGSGSPSALAVSSDGSHLAIGDGNGGVYLWDLAGPRLTATLRRATGGVNANGVESLAFSPDGKTLAAGLGTGQIIVLDVASGQATATLDDGYGQGGVDGLAFSPDGKTLATGTQGGPGLVILWNVATGLQVAKLNPGLAVVASVAYSPDGETLAIGCDGGTVLWDLATGQTTNITAVTAASGPVLGVTYGPDGKTLAISGFGGTVLRDLAAGRNIAILPGAGAVAFSPDGKILATGWGTAQLWDTITGRKIATLGSMAARGSITFLPHGSTVTANGGTGAIMWTSAT
jgi:RNA polymerase sigma factor (sigma-70 family)